MLANSWCIVRHNQHYCQAYASHGKSNSEFKLEDAAELAHDIIADVTVYPPSTNPIPLDPGTLLSFWTYPKADAHAYVKHKYTPCFTA